MSDTSAPAKRTTWKTKKHLMYAMLCWILGIHHCIGFPTLLNTSGSVTYVWLYAVFVLLFGIPMTMVEIALGQYSGKGALHIWDLCPLMKGLGYVSVTMLFGNLVAYNSFLTYTLYYIYVTVLSSMPWVKCDERWASQGCFTFEENSTKWYHCVQTYGWNTCQNLTWRHSSAEYFENSVMNEDLGVWFGTLQPHLVVCSSISMILTFLVNAKGNKYLEKFVGFLAIFPILPLGVLTFVVMSSEGSYIGLHFFFAIDVSDLSQGSLWAEAVEQLVACIGLGLSGLPTLGKTAHFRNSLQMQAVIVCLSSVTFAVTYTMMLCALLGSLSYDSHISINEILSWNHPMFFVTAPMAIPYVLTTPHPILAFLLFFSVYLIGLRCQFVSTFIFLEIMYDFYPKASKHSVVTSLIFCACVFLLNLPFLTQNGASYMKNRYKVFLGTGMFLCVFGLNVAVMWCYGLGQFTDDLHFMLGYRPSLIFQILWFAVPILLLAAFVMQVPHYFYFSAYASGGSADWVWSSVVGVLKVAPFVVVGVFVGVHLARNRRKGAWKKLLKASSSWGPADSSLTRSRLMFTAHGVTKEFLYRQNRRNSVLDDNSAESDASS